MRPYVVIFSEDAQFYLMLSHILDVDGFQSAPANSVADFKNLANTEQVAAILLDCRRDGRSTRHAQALAQTKFERRPIFVALLEAGSEKQQFDLIRAGVKEQLSAPFVPAKLLEYLRSMLRSKTGEGRPTSASLCFGDITLDPETHRVTCRSVELPVGPIEYKILKLLLGSPDRVFSRAELISAAWVDGKDVGARTVDVHVSRLRGILRDKSKSVSVRTVRLAGYALELRERAR